MATEDPSALTPAELGDKFANLTARLLAPNRELGRPAFDKLEEKASAACPRCHRTEGCGCWG